MNEFFIRANKHYISTLQSSQFSSSPQLLLYNKSYILDYIKLTLLSLLSIYL